MKKIKFAFFFLAFTVLMISCSKNDGPQAIDDLALLTEEGETQNSGLIEYTSLEDMNALFVENGFEAVTLEDLGVTQEEYDAAQAKVNNPNGASVRCTGELAVRYLDINGSDSFSTYDIYLARIGILYGYSGGVYDDFGLADLIWPRPEDGATGPPTGGSSALTLGDVTVARKIVLGIYVCQ